MVSIMEAKRLALIVGVLIVALFVVIIVPNLGFKQVIEMDLNVADYAGFNVDTDKLFFGSTTPGSTSRREIVVENIWEDELFVTLIATGELRGWSSFSDNKFVIKPGETKGVNITVSVPKNAEVRKYTGKTVIHFKKI